MMENLVIYRNVRRLLQSYAMIFLVTKIKKSCLKTGSQHWIPYITLDRKEYMLLVQFDWTVCEVVLLIQTKISWKMAEALRITVVIAILEKWLWSGSKIAWLISHQTLLELSQLGSLKDGVEMRRWEKTFNVSNCSTLQQKHGRSWPDGHVDTIASNTVQEKALVPKYILASHWYSKDQCLDPIPSSFSSEWKTT